MAKYTVIVLVILLFGPRLLAQLPGSESEDGYPGPSVPPSPTVAALNEYVDVPVSLYTGVPQIDIPLYEINSLELSLPISLSYHSNGVKVEETPSWVGANWSLNAGGVISRNMNTLPDDVKDRFIRIDHTTLARPYIPDGHGEPLACMYNYQVNKAGRDFDRGAGYLYSGGSEAYNYFYDYLAGEIGGPALFEDDDPQHWANRQKRNMTRQILDNRGIDLSPDIFYYNFGPYTGKFVLTVTGKVQLIPQDNIKISLIRSTGSDEEIIGFEVVDDQGIKYTFEAIERTEILDGYVDAQDKKYDFTPSTVITQARSCFDVEELELHDVETCDKGVLGSRFNIAYNSAWYLTRIESLNNNDYITFEYADEQTVRLSNIQRTYGFFPETSAPESKSNSMTVMNTKRLSAIRWPNGSITFDPADEARTDLYSFSDQVNNPDLGGTTVQMDAPSTARALKAIKIYDKDFRKEVRFNTPLPGITRDCRCAEWPQTLLSPAMVRWGPGVLPREQQPDTVSARSTLYLPIQLH